MHTVESYRLIAQRMINSSELVLQYSRNRQATGLQRENILRSYIQQVIPASLHLTTGFSHSEKGSSNQIDIILYDKQNFGVLYEEGGYSILYPESILACFEVKSNLNGDAIREGLENIATAKRTNQLIQGFLFGFEGVALQTAISHLSEHLKQIQKADAYQLPEVIVNLGNWVLVKMKVGNRLAYVWNEKSTFEEQFAFFWYQVYFSSYGYNKDMHKDNKLPSLKDRGFDLSPNVDLKNRIEFG